RGEDNRPVKPNRIVKSIGIEDTFETDLKEEQEMRKELQLLCEKLARRLTDKEKQGRTVTLKIKFADFTQITRSKTSGFYLCAAIDIFQQVTELFDKTHISDREVRLLGVTLSNFYDADQEKLNTPQMRLF